MNQRTQFNATTMLLLLASIAISAASAQPGDYRQQAMQILDSTGVRGGLIVHVGCGDGKLTAALRANDSYIVHGLDSNPANVATARTYIQSLGQYGEVFVEQMRSLGFRVHKIIKREIPSKILPQTRDPKSGRFTSAGNAGQALAYPYEYILIMEKK